MTILDLAKVSSVNVLFFVRDALRENFVEVGTAAMVVTLGSGAEVKIEHLEAKENALYITAVK